MRSRFIQRDALVSISIFVLVFGVLVSWSLAIARYGGPDEPAHVLRAASVANGELFGSRVPGLAPGFRAVTVPAALATGDPSCFRHDARAPATCAVARPGSGVRLAASSAGTYPPLYYAIVGLPVRLFGDPAQVQWYRLVAAFWCAMVLAVTVRRSGVLPAGALALCALSPAAWFLFGVVNPNAMEIALALLAWVGVMRLRRPRSCSVGELMWFSLPIGLAIAIRPVAVLAWLAMIAVLCFEDVSGVRPMLRLSSWRARLGAFGAPVLATASVVVWGWWSGQQIDDPRTRTSMSLPATLWRSMRGSGDTLRELAGSLGWLEFSSPAWTQLVWWIVVAACALTLWRAGSQARRRWLSVVALLLVTPVIFETLVAHRIGLVWQGRYSIPVAIGLVASAMNVRLQNPRHAFTRAWGVGGAVFVMEFATYWYSLRRYTVGINGSWLFRNAGWHPPVASLVLLALNALLMAAVLVMQHRWSVRAFGDLASNDVEC